MSKTYYVYILANQRNGTLYTGVTNNLERRIYEHKSGIIKGFTSKFITFKLVFYQQFTDINDAITMEKRLKKWRRNWKKDLIEEMNPDWKDLSMG